MPAMDTQNSEYVAFKLCEESYAVDIRIIKTVEKILPITRVPKAEDYIVGVINLRGDIIPIIDLRKRFGMLRSEFTEDSRIMVITLESMIIGAVVDGVDEVMDIPYGSIINSTNINSTINENFVLGVAKFENKVVTILNFEQIASIDE